MATQDLVGLILSEIYCNIDTTLDVSSIPVIPTQEMNYPDLHLILQNCSNIDNNQD